MIQASNVFWRNYTSKKRIVINRGGTRAGKTYSLCQLLARWLLTGELRQGEIISSGVCSVVRKTLPSLKATAQKDFEEILTNWGVLHSKVRHRVVDREYIFDGRVVEFFSVDDQQKVRGRKRKILFCNEANELNFDTDFFQLLIRTENTIFIDFNPSDPYTWIKTELEDKRAHTMQDVQTIISTYLDNPFLPKSLIKEVESISDPDLRKVYVHGQYGIIKGLIFPKVTIVPEMPEILKRPGGGLDFGYTNDPTALYHCGFYRGGLYIDERMYSVGMEDDDIVESIKSSKLRNLITYADSQEPKTINALNRMNVTVKGAVKGKDSIKYGIKVVKKYPIFITATSQGLLKEQKLYKWLVNPDGRATNKPINKFNHGWDAVRYYTVMTVGQGRNVQAFG
ncbi:MAG: PBSX family phage terminase large subunit [Saprospiraceae bacterium]|uniref:PBSX family phage terminase large subunit n=1 Tax=Kordia sp. TaxID=1965332 RepID=UPI0025BC3CC9|nr:PBSX family phage terminase large subunit [Kordia sp.]MCH2043972.1 PBSX family phage terminase large subunit [Saprospiraceae bacterium]MCH2196822.1 PBSX family phage terminase large subunit [Kordia sp.]